MPYADEIVGVYRVVDTVAGACYVGQSRRVKKRIAEHFRLLRLGTHPNPRLQESYNTNGESAFEWEVEVVCSDPADLDAVEEAFLKREAVFTPHGELFNISSTAKTPMAGRHHSEATKQAISEKKKGDRRHVTTEYRARLSRAQLERRLADPAFVAKVKYILDNEHLSYAERGRRLGVDTSSVRKLALKYRQVKEILK